MLNEYAAADPVLITHGIPDGSTGLFLRAVIRLASGTLVGNVDMTHVSDGTYAATTSLSAGQYSVTILVFTDAGRTVKSSVWGSHSSAIVVRNTVVGSYVPGESVLLVGGLIDGEPGLFPQAVVRDVLGATAATVNLAHASDGTYGGLVSSLALSAGSYSVTIQFFTDAGRTTESLEYGSVHYDITVRVPAAGGGGTTIEVIGETILVVEDQPEVILIAECRVADDGDTYAVTLSSPPDVEIGQSVSPAFTATHSTTPSSLLLSNDSNATVDDVVSTPTSFSASDAFVEIVPNSSVLFTLSGVSIDGSDTATARQYFRARHFIGTTSSPGPYTEADILALDNLTSELTADRLFDLTLAALSGEYIVHAYPEAFAFDASKYIADNLFEVGMSEVQVGLSMARPGGTFNVDVARTNSPQDTFGDTIRIERRS